VSSVPSYYSIITAVPSLAIFVLYTVGVPFLTAADKLGAVAENGLQPPIVSLRDVMRCVRQPPSKVP